MQSGGPATNLAKHLLIQWIFLHRAVGDTVSEAVELTNTGDTSIEVSAITITGADAGEFDYDLLPPFTVDPGVPVTLNVTFTPASGGMKTALVNNQPHGGQPGSELSLWKG